MCLKMYRKWFWSCACQTPLTCCWRFKNRGLDSASQSNSRNCIHVRGIPPKLLATLRDTWGSTETLGAKKSTQTFFVQSFSTTLRVMDVRAENRGRPYQKVRFPAAPVVGRNFLTPGHSGVRVRNVHGKSGPKSLCLCCFFFPETWVYKSSRQLHCLMSRWSNLRCNAFVMRLWFLSTRRTQQVRAQLHTFPTRSLL